MADATAIALGAAVGVATAELAHGTGAYYHDAIRPLARDLRSGATSRREVAGYSWGVSWRFVLFFAAPFSILTGAVVSHLLFLPAEAVAIRALSRVAAWLCGAVLGALGVAATIGAHALLEPAQLDITPQLAALLEPVLWLYPLVPLAAAAKLPRVRAGLAVTAASAGGSAAILAVSGEADLAAPVAAVTGAAALLAFHLAGAPRRPAPALAAQPSAHIRRAVPLLLVIGASVAALASMHRLAGDPLAAILISDGRTLDAAVIAVLTFVAFWPLVAVSSVTADSYASQGTPDLGPAAGYAFSGLGAVAAAAGAVAMAAEVVLRRRSVQLVMGRPVLTEVASAIRDALGDVSLLALLLGGFALAAATAGPVGFLAVGAAWLANERAGSPVTRLAVAPAAALLVAVAAEAWNAVA